MILGLIDGFHDVSVEPLTPDAAVVALNSNAQVWLAGLERLETNPMIHGPFHQLLTAVLRLVHP
jgi:hypothetical protein